ncbi:hypothetical protein GQ457_09G012180 [Hibiscus cannabinus]
MESIVAYNATLLSINYDLWRQMPNSNKNQTMDYVKEWRDCKSSLKKKHFKNNLNIKEKLQNVWPGMLKYQWKILSGFGCVEIVSRQQQNFTHTAMSKSFARIASEEILFSLINEY